MKQVQDKAIPRGQMNPQSMLEHAAWISELARQARADILIMTTLAGSGHPGGSLSSIDIYLTLWSFTNTSPETIDSPERDRIVISHGHTAPAVYAALGRLGYFDPMEAVHGFRRHGSIFEGHADPRVPGVEWACGNLGQGLSAACGFALSALVTKMSYRTYCVMGDGEQQKGQIAEARRFAVRHGLDSLTAIIDCNNLQAMGSVRGTMPQDLAAEWETAGWHVIQVDGHDPSEIHSGLEEAAQMKGKPSVVLARTVMGKGVSFIEDRYEYHGKILDCASCEQALVALGLADRRMDLSTAFACSATARAKVRANVEELVKTGEPRTYSGDVDCRSAFGNALEDIALGNEQIPMAVFDCDLAASVKTDGFANLRPTEFFQCGIQEHSAATIAGATSKCGVLSFFVDFGVFGIDETYNQHRLNDINNTSIKLICTHCGLDVGEDGKTHQCIDYIGQAANLYGFKLIIPADANQTDRAVRYIASTPGRFLVAVGRTRCPVITDEAGLPLFGDDYSYEYGRADWIRLGTDCTIITAGSMVQRAVRVSEMLLNVGVRAGVINVSSPLDLDVAALKEAFRTGFVITYEDHHIRTGIGSLIAGFIADNSVRCHLLRLGVTAYGVSASPEENYRHQGLDPESVAKRILEQAREN